MFLSTIAVYAVDLESDTFSIEVNVHNVLLKHPFPINLNRFGLFV